MKSKIFLSLIAISFSFVGCYTSFSAREYEEETYGQIDENAQVDSMIVFEDESGNLDTVYLYAGNYEEVSDEPIQNTTVINNYYDDNECWFGGFYGFPRFYYPVSYYSCYDPYYYDPYCYDYYRPYYGGSVYVGVDLYVGHYSGGNYYAPSPERYRTQQSHWTNLRNNDGGRKTTRKSRDSYRELAVTNKTEFTGIMSKGIDLDRDMRKSTGSRKRTELASLNDGGIRRADLDLKERIINTNNEIKRASVVKSTIPRKVVTREAVQQTRPKRTTNSSKYSREKTSRKRTYSEIQKRSSYGKRKNSSTNNVKNNSKSKSSPKSYSRTNENRRSYSSKSANNKSNSRSSYNSNSSRSKSKPSASSYSSNNSSSRSSYSGSSSRSSSRSSYTGSSSRSSSKSSGSSSSSRSSSSRSSGRRK